MNITAIITEYNPFHNGHLYHLNSAKSITKSDGVICIMSGNFVQRGGPSIIDKWKKAELAILNGVDLVIELPTFYATSSAEFFASGSVAILNGLGVVNSIFFGSECGVSKPLIDIAQILVDEPTDFKVDLKKNLDQGLTFAKAREMSLKKVLSKDNLSDVLSSSNNILGIEYIKAILKLNSNIQPLTLKREGSCYNDVNLSESFSSATSIRNSLKKSNSLNSLKDYLPEKSFDFLTSLHDGGYNFVFEEEMFKFIKYKLLSNCIIFNNLTEIVEGLDNKILKEITYCESLNEFILKIKSKRYTYTKISRLLTQIYIGIDTYESSTLLDPSNLYARILGFNSTGKKILKEIKKSSSIPVITKLSKHLDNPLLKLDIQATRCYSILNNHLDSNSDFLKSPIIKD